MTVEILLAISLETRQALMAPFVSTSAGVGLYQVDYQCRHNTYLVKLFGMRFVASDLHSHR